MPANAPAKFDVENIMKDQIMSHIFSHDNKILMPLYSLPANDSPVSQSSTRDSGQTSSHSDPTLANKSDLLRYYMGMKEEASGSAQSTLPDHAEKSEDILASAIRRAIACTVMETNRMRMSIRGSLSIRVDDQAPITLTFADDAASPTATKSVSATPSKRKAYLPVKYTALTPSSDSSSSSSSSSTSPSPSESYALDLSKGNSTAPSNEITPVKQDATPSSLLFNSVAILKQTGFFGSCRERQSTLPSVPTTPSQIHRSPGEINSVPTKRRRINTSSVRKFTSARVFSCNQCQDEFNSLYDLEHHTISKHETYRCMCCRASFTQRSNLQRHSLKHVGFKPFECGICDKSYFRKDHLMRHMETSHPDVPPRESIRILLTSSESLDYLSRLVKLGMTNGVVKGGSIADGNAAREGGSPLSKTGQILTGCDGAKCVKSKDSRRSSESLSVAPDLKWQTDFMFFPPHSTPDG